LLIFSGKIRSYFSQLRRKSRENKQDNTEDQE
jgi:hypothetical protein